MKDIAELWGARWRWAQHYYYPAVSSLCFFRRPSCVSPRGLCARRVLEREVTGWPRVAVARGVMTQVTG